MKKIVISVLFVVLFLSHLYSTELPKPTYDNSLIFSFTHYFLEEDEAEIDYIKTQFGNGIYAPLCFSRFFGVKMNWDINPGNSSSGIQTFKNDMDEVVAFAKYHNVGVHLTLNFGMARLVTYYNDAKKEDVRNAQWYNDNNISSASQASGASVPSYRDSTIPIDLNHVDPKTEAAAKPEAADSVVNGYVFTTLSRYARKLRAHLKGKASAALAYLEQLQDANPDVIIVISAPGEAELNYNRINNSQYMQDYFCDYSPFAVLEFRDWVRHQGLYATGEEYAGEGYTGGGSRYQGGSGLSNFNTDFGTSFSTWDLKYFNWDLSDTVDTNYTDAANPDPNTIPVAQYTQNSMMPTSGGNYIAGGFDPPRTMMQSGTDTFYDLWHTFRETLVYHYVKDMAKIARSSGFDRDKYYTHQIPADYLFGTRPNDPAIPLLNPRYYSSAAPMWSADAYSDTGMGVTLYDVNLGSAIYRTTLYGIGGADATSNNWAALEYNPEVIPAGISTTISSASTLKAEMLKLYNGSPHVISFFKWKGNNNEYRFEGTNRETAAKNFFNDIKDRARQPVSTVFTPKEVENPTAGYASATINLSWSSLIWTDLNWTWSDWGDFQQFVIYRGYTSGFTANAASELTRLTTTTYADSSFQAGGYVYYKIAAVNKNGTVGPTQSLSVNTAGSSSTPVLSVSKSQLTFNSTIVGASLSNQSFSVSNSGIGTLNWTLTDNKTWLSCSPTSGTQGDNVTVSVNPSGLSAGSYSGSITVSATGIAGSPKTVAVTLNVQGAGSPILNIARSELNFGHILGENAPPVQGFRISNIGTGALNWSASKNAQWLSCDPVSAAFGTVVNVTVDPTGLAAGSYNDIITVSAPEAEDSPQSIAITLTVKSSSQNQLPFGDFSTPLNNAAVSSSIPVTGWVLDDVGIDTLKIYRDPVTGEGTSLVYIGDALFVEGARTDIETAYPDYPANYQAGWGYMLLSNFLPNGGNGTFRLHAIATDTSGAQVTLGTTTIVCNNANAVKPFGAIDTPNQGGTATGSSFRNHGWALTPMPNLIPTDGSTIDVYIDGVNVGNPVYNIYRSDIAAFFPWYSNSTGAGGYFDIDTTSYDEGIHTIAWIATDFVGNSDGIGSRYFTVSNSGSARTARGVGKALSMIPLDNVSPIGVVKGFGKNAKLQKVIPHDNGTHDNGTIISIKELERVEIHLPHTSSANWTGCLVSGNKLRPLPAGSTLDTRNSVFYWMPGPGFIGDYTFDFIGKNNRKRITIKIHPK